MIDLIRTLEKVEEWLINNQPEALSELRQGISRVEIDNLINSYPLKFSEELYQLYEWKDGIFDPFESPFAPWLFMYYGFKSLSSALLLYNDLIMEGVRTSNDFRDCENGWDTKWLPVFVLDSKDYLVVICDENSNSSSIYNWFVESGNLRLKYITITSMFQSLLESYQNGVYGVNEYGELEVDYEEHEKIRLKYNPDTTSFL